MDAIRPVGPAAPGVARIDGLDRLARAGERDADGRRPRDGRREQRQEPDERPGGPAATPGDGRPEPERLDVRA